MVDKIQNYHQLIILRCVHEKQKKKKMEELRHKKFNIFVEKNSHLVEF